MQNIYIFTKPHQHINNLGNLTQATTKQKTEHNVKNTKYRFYKQSQTHGLNVKIYLEKHMLSRAELFTLTTIITIIIIIIIIIIITSSSSSSSSQSCTVH